LTNTTSVKDKHTFITHNTTTIVVKNTTFIQEQNQYISLFLLSFAHQSIQLKSISFSLPLCFGLSFRSPGPTGRRRARASDTKAPEEEQTRRNDLQNKQSQITSNICSIISFRPKRTNQHNHIFWIVNQTNKSTHPNPQGSIIQTSKSALLSFSLSFSSSFAFPPPASLNPTPLCAPTRAIYPLKKNNHYNINIHFLSSPPNKHSFSSFSFNTYFFLTCSSRPCTARPPLVASPCAVNEQKHTVRTQEQQEQLACLLHECENQLRPRNGRILRPVYLHHADLHNTPQQSSSLQSTINKTNHNFLVFVCTSLGLFASGDRGIAFGGGPCVETTRVFDNTPELRLMSTAPSDGLAAPHTPEEKRKSSFLGDILLRGDSRSPRSDKDSCRSEEGETGLSGTFKWKCTGQRHVSHSAASASSGKKEPQGSTATSFIKPPVTPSKGTKFLTTKSNRKPTEQRPTSAEKCDETKKKTFFDL
jgi:hypothetical protein